MPPIEMVAGRPQVGRNTASEMDIGPFLRPAALQPVKRSERSGPSWLPVVLTSNGVETLIFSSSKGRMNRRAISLGHPPSSAMGRNHD